MFTVFQSVSGSSGQVRVFADSMVLSDGNIIFASLFGTTAAIKSVAAQIIENRLGILACDENGQYIMQTHLDHPLHLMRGDDHLRMLTKNIKPGIVHKILYAEELFTSCTKDGRFIAHGKDSDEMVLRAFKSLNRLSDVPMKESWKDWLYHSILLPGSADCPVTVCGDDPQFACCSVFVKPDNEQLEEQIRLNLPELKGL